MRGSQAQGICDFCANQDIVDAIAEDVSNGRLYKRSVRVGLLYYLIYLRCSDNLQLDDPGFIAHSGFTSGNRGDPRGFGWAHNLRYARHHKDCAFVESLGHRESSLAAFFWNLACGSLPDEVTGAYTSYLEENALTRMALGPVDFEPRGEYTLHLPSDDPLVPPNIHFNAVP